MCCFEFNNHNKHILVVDNILYVNQFKIDIKEYKAAFLDLFKKIRYQKNLSTTAVKLHNEAKFVIARVMNQYWITFVILNSNYEFGFSIQREDVGRLEEIFKEASNVD